MIDNKRIFRVEMCCRGIVTLLPIINKLRAHARSLITLWYFNWVNFVILYVSLISIDCIESFGFIDTEAARMILVSFKTIPCINLICLRSSTSLHRELAELNLGCILIITWYYADNKLILTILTLDFPGLSLLVISWCGSIRSAWDADAMH